MKVPSILNLVELMVNFVCALVVLGMMCAVAFLILAAFL